MMTQPMRQALALAVLSAAVTAGCGESPEALLASGKAYLENRDNPAAVIQLRNALQKNPDLAEARFLLGKTLLESGDAAGAEKELRAAAALQYPDEQVVPPWARSLVLIGEFKKVIEDLAKVDIADPQGKAELLTSVGQAHLALGSPEPARDAFTAALAAQPKYVPAYIGQAQIFAQAGNLAEASKTIDDALAIAPSAHDALQLKGDILVAQKQVEPALAAYQKALDAKPDFLAAHTAIVSLLIQQRKIEEAAKQVNAMKQVAPKHPQTLYLQALVAYLQKDFPAARETILEQLRAAPDNLRGLLLAGVIELELKSYGQAEMYALKVLDRLPRNRLARRTVIMSHLRNGQPAKALDALKPVLNGIGNDAPMLALAGEVFMVNGQTTQAADYFAKAAAINPSDVSTRTSLALSRAIAGDTDRAFHDLEQASAADSGIRADLALIAGHVQRREYDKALSAVGSVEKKQPGTALPQSLRGSIYLAKRDIASARRSFERAIEIDPMYFPAAASLSEIDVAENNLDAARQRYERIIAKDPKHVQALVALAGLRVRAANAGGAQAASAPDAEAVALLNKAVAANPTDPAPRLTLIGYYLSANDAKSGARVAQEAVAAFPDRVEILDAAGRTYQAAGEPFQALKMYEKLASLQRTSAQPYIRMAEIHLAAKNRDQAMTSLQKALDIQPDSLDAQRGIIALEVEAGRVAQALTVARQVQKQRPDQSDGFILEGDIHASQKNWSEAASAYRKGLVQKASPILATRLHGVLAASDAKEADRFAATWLKDHPKDRAFRLHLAETATVKKDYANAAQQYRKLLDADPNSAVLLNNIAWVEGQLKDPKALEHAETANKLAPNQPAIMDTLGMLLVEKGETARGMELLQKATAMAPQAPSIRLNFAKALIKTGQKNAARKELDELAKLGDKFAGQSEVTELKQSL
jgi:putative PEP-CTERM system TPR-repeat lipoprotein